MIEGHWYIRTDDEMPEHEGRPPAPQLERHFCGWVVLSERIDAEPATPYLMLRTEHFSCMRDAVGFRLSEPETLQVHVYRYFRGRPELYAGAAVNPLYGGTPITLDEDSTDA